MIEVYFIRLSMFAFLINDPAVNKDRIIKLCLVHDLVEAEILVEGFEAMPGLSKEEVGGFVYTFYVKLRILLVYAESHYLSVYRLH